MNKQQARHFIRSHPDFTWGDAKEVLRTARKSGKDFTQRSSVNTVFTKGTSFNFLWEGIENKPDGEKVNGSRVWFVAAKIVQDFGAWAGLCAAPGRKKSHEPPLHQEPMEI